MAGTSLLQQGRVGRVRIAQRDDVNPSLFVSVASDMEALRTESSIQLDQDVIKET